MITTILFDMDGVITNTEGYHFQSWQEAFSIADKKLTADIYRQHVQARKHEDAIGHVLDTEDLSLIQDISDHKRRVYRRLINQQVKVYNDTINLLEHLYQKDVTLAVVSASSMAKEVLDKAGIRHYFDMVIEGTKDNNLRNKPHPDLYEYAMKQLDSKPEETLIIEDSLSGINAGIASGANVIGVARDKLKEIKHDRYKCVNKLTLSTLGGTI